MVRDSLGTENLFKAIDERRDELVELTRALIRFPIVIEGMVNSAKVMALAARSLLHGTT
jgi:hypothetical protein